MKTGIIKSLIFAVGMVANVHAGELVAGFINPDFGGNPNNGGVLLSEASAQNGFTAPKTTTTTATSASSSASTTPTSGQLFAQQLNQLVLNALANKLVSQAFGTGTTTLPSNSTINTGINTVTIQAVGNGTQVTIVDNATGGQTVLNIPNY